MTRLPLPKLFTLLPHYRANDLWADLTAGVTVGALALPLSMAFAIASGTPPLNGVWTAVIAGVSYGLLGGSRVLVAGPASAFIPLLFAIVSQFGPSALLAATWFAGLILLLLGLFRLGNLVRLIPNSVITGFINGIAVIIILTQVKDFLGLALAVPPSGLVGKLRALYDALPTLQPASAALGFGSLALLLGWTRLERRIPKLKRLPAPLVTLVAGTAIVWWGELPVATIGSRFGAITSSLPAFTLPVVDWTQFTQLLPAALAIAVLGATESLVTARFADEKIDDLHNPNQELFAQGVANLLTPMVGGLPATGAMGPTATNIRCGAQTPISGLVHALTVLFLIVLFAPAATHVPLPTLATIVMVTAYNMGSWRRMHWRLLRRYPPNYRSTLLITFLLTVLFEVTIAVEVGLLLTSFSFIHRMTRLSAIHPIDLTHHRAAQALRDSTADGSVEAYRFSGPLFFGVVPKFDALLRRKTWPQWVLLDLHQMIAIDDAGIELLERLDRQIKRHGGSLRLVGLQAQPKRALARSGFLAELGAHAEYPTLSEALYALRNEQEAKTAAPIQ
jgi:SulP family sulfate permease